MLLPLLLSTCLLPSVTGQMQCLHCANATEATCKGTVIACKQPNDSCITYIEKVSVGAKDTTLFLRMCGKCDMFIPSTVRFNQGTVKSNITCCKTPSCTPVVPIIAPEKPSLKDEKSKEKTNGITCKSCYTSAKTCDCNTYVSCNGGETNCTQRNMIVSTSRSSSGSFTYFMAVRGCSTTSTCNVLGPKSYKLEPLSVTSEIFCSSDGKVLHLSPAVLVLSATSLLFFRPVMR